MKVYLGKYKKNRKEKVKIHKYDSWNADVTLAKIIKPVLEQLRDTTHGYPNEFMSIEGDEYMLTAAYNQQHMGGGMEGWQATLDKMIWSFGEAANEYEDAPYGDTTATKAYFARVQEGFTLFGRFYMGLWD
jgi:hypothetical protein